jgi:long-chain acyl-CoA synthetase
MTVSESEKIMDKPWTLQYDPGMTETLNYPDKTLYEMLVRTENNFPFSTAISFEKHRISFRSLLFQVDAIALALKELGLKRGDVATICLPNIPQAVVFFYAVNKIGVIANMVHPKTPAFELKDFITSTRSEYLIILDAFLPKHVAMLSQIPIKSIFVASITDYLSSSKRAGFILTKGRKIPRIPADKKYITWHELKKRGFAARYAAESLAASFQYERPLEPASPAVYLHSGGTTGTPKTIVLSSQNINVLAVQGPQIVNIPDPFETGVAPCLSMVTILPLFHGFGLCMGMHTMICNAITSILVPQFTPDSLAKVIMKERPAFIAAVPTLYEGILKSTLLRKANLSFLQCCFCGGDSLSPDLKDRFEAFIHERGSGISLREGYGLTETVTVCCVNPEYKSRKESVGLPLPDISMKIVEPGTHNEVPAGEKGEICVCGPTTMLGYLGDPQGTTTAVQRHGDGQMWVHTGDYGSVDEDGFFHFTQRIKRIIKVSGIPVFPSQIEAVISSVPGIHSVCAIAVSDPYRIHVVKAIVVASAPHTEEHLMKIKSDILAACEERLISYSRPALIEFRDHLPQTLVGKIDYIALEKEESDRSAAALS